MLCPFCKTELKSLNNQKYCHFCEMTVNVVSQRPVTIKGYVDHVDARKNTPELMNYHSYDLLLLLKFCREQRRDSYQLMQVFKRVIKEDSKYQTFYREALNDYEFWTKKAKITESILNSKIGFVPAAVTNKLLIEYYSLAEELNTLEKLYA